MGFIASSFAKFYIGLEGTGGTDWFEVPIVRDVTLSAEIVAHEVTHKGHDGFKAFLPTLVDARYEFQVNVTTDEIYGILEALYDSRTACYLVGLDGEMGSGDGRVIWGNIVQFKEGQSLEGNVVVDMIAIPSGYLTSDDLTFTPILLSDLV